MGTNSDSDVLVSWSAAQQRSRSSADCHARRGTRLARGVAMRTLVVLMLCAAAACSSNDSVWSSSVTKLVLKSAGGFLPPSQPTADCPTEGVEYTLIVADRTLSARRCSPAPGAPYPLLLS